MNNWFANARWRLLPRYRSHDFVFIRKAPSQQPNNTRASFSGTDSNNNTINSKEIVEQTIFSAKELNNVNPTPSFIMAQNNRHNMHIHSFPHPPLALIDKNSLSNSISNYPYFLILPISSISFPQNDWYFYTDFSELFLKIKLYFCLKNL